MTLYRIRHYDIPHLIGLPVPLQLGHKRDPVDKGMDLLRDLQSESVVVNIIDYFLSESRGNYKSLALDQDYKLSVEFLYELIVKSRVMKDELSILYPLFIEDIFTATIRNSALKKRECYIIASVPQIIRERMIVVANISIKKGHEILELYRDLKGLPELNDYEVELYGGYLDTISDTETMRFLSHYADIIVTRELKLLEGTR